MKCKHCGQEIIKQETLKIKELNIEITKVIHLGESYDVIKNLIPNGWRLLKVEEAFYIINNHSDFIEFYDEKHDFFIQQPIKKNEENGYVAWFNAHSGRADLNCFRDPSNSDSSLGVVLCKDIKNGK